MGIDLFAQKLREATEPVTIAISGPLTNVALLLAAHPELHSKIKRIVLMGGALNTGNRRPGIEYNFSIDPDAAKMVANAGIPLVIITRDLTEQAEISREVVTRMASIDNPVAQAAAQLILNYGDYAGQAPVVLNDPEVIAYLLQPEMFKGQTVKVDVETQGDLTRGRLVVDYDSSETNALVLTTIDNDQFVNLILNSLRTYSNN